MQSTYTPVYCCLIQTRLAIATLTKYRVVSCSVPWLPWPWLVGRILSFLTSPLQPLDVTTQIEVLAAIKRIVRQFNTAAIYITHDLAVVAQIADRIMVLRHGNLVEENNARSMLANPKEEYTRQLLSVRMMKEEKDLSKSEKDVVLEVNNVTASYTGKDNVLEDINLKIRRGRTVALVGESGSGKSTLARVITGLLPPIRGDNNLWWSGITTATEKPQ